MLHWAPLIFIIVIKSKPVLAMQQYTEHSIRSLLAQGLLRLTSPAPYAAAKETRPLPFSEAIGLPSSQLAQPIPGIWELSFTSPNMQVGESIAPGMEIARCFAL